MALKALIIAERAARIASYPGDTPVASVEILGQSLLARLVQHLQRCGVRETVVVTDIEEDRLAADGVRFVRCTTPELWKCAERTFADLESAGVHGVVVLRADHYAEVDWESVLSHHVHFRNRVTGVFFADDAPAADVYLISAGFRNEAAQLMRTRFAETRTPGVRYRSRGYVNLMQDCSGLRTLVKDALYGLNQIKPMGKEIRPGIWIGKDARIERHGRVVAPAYIGAHARIRGGAVVTRDSVIEHHSTVDCGSVVEDAHVQPYTAIGAGLDVVHSIVEGTRLFHLTRNAEFSTDDAKLLRERKENAAVRTAQAAAALLSYLPALVINSARRKRVAVATCDPERTFELHPGDLSGQPEDMAKLAPGLAVVRRYGNE
jgi:hypothetical protein